MGPVITHQLQGTHSNLPYSNNEVHFDLWYPLGSAILGTFGSTSIHNLLCGILEPYAWKWTTIQGPSGSSMASKPQGEPVAKPGTRQLIILNITCESDIKKVHGKLSNPLFRENVHGRKHPGEVNTCKNNIPYINHFILCNQFQHSDNQCPERTGQHRPSLLPSVRQ